MSCWVEGPLGVCGDRFDPIDPAVSLNVQTGELLTLRFDRPISPTRVTVFRSDRPAFPFPTVNALEVPPANPTQFRADLAPGTYFLFVSTTWAQGHASYVFEITVVASTTTTQATTTSTLQATTTTTGQPTTTTTAAVTTTTAPSGTTTTTAGPAPGTCDNLTPTIVGTAGRDNIIGTPGNDVILAGGGNDSVSGGGGNDVICGGAGNDRLIGGDGDDRLFGDAGTDQLFGGPGNDTLNGGLNGDMCFGEAGTDTAAACETISGLP
jgi:Ca2+-binding RTX toxin-like protein